MSTQLEEKLNKILAEKKEKILPENIRKGIKLFDVDGSLEILDTSDADATAKDIAMNKTAYVNGKKITGTLLEPSMSSISTDNIIDTGSRVDIEGKMPIDYLFRKNSSITYNIKYPSLANAIGLTSEKIMKGNTVIGVTGNATSDANATAADILKNKTAYVNGVKVVGTHEDTSSGGENENNALLVYPTSETSFILENLIKKIDVLDLNGKGYSSMFRDCKYLEEVKELKNWGNASLYRTFYGCIALKKPPKISLTNALKTLNATFYGSGITELNDSYFDFSNVTNLSEACRICYSLTKVNINPSPNLTNLKYTFYRNTALTEVKGNFYGDYLINVSEMFAECSNLEWFDGIINIGKAYTEQTAGYGNYRYSVVHSPKMQKESLLRMIDGLYDLNLTYDVVNGGTLYTQSFRLGDANLAKLTAEEIAVATEKRMDSILIY